MNGVLIAISSEPKLHPEPAILEQTSCNHLGQEHNIFENFKSWLSSFLKILLNQIVDKTMIVAVKANVMEE